MNTNQLDLAYLKQSLLRALPDQMPASLVAVTGGLKEKEITILAYFSDRVSEEDYELVREMGTEVIADFPSDYRIHELARSIEDGPLQILDFWAFKRANKH